MNIKQGYKYVLMKNEHFLQWNYVSFEAHVERGVNALAVTVQKILPFTKLIEVAVVGSSVDFSITFFLCCL